MLLSKQRPKLLLVGALITAAICAPAFAQAPAPIGVEAEYSATVWGLPVGQVALDATLEAGRYDARAVSEAAGLAALFTDIRIVSEVEGAVSAGRARPNRYAHDEFNGDKHRRIDMSFDNQVARSLATPNFSNWGEPPASDIDRTGAIDPMTAVFMLAQSMTGTELCSGVLPVFDGRLRYNLNLRARGREEVRTRAWSGEAVVCDAFYEPISGYTDEQRPEPRELRHPLTLWLRPLEGGTYLPVKMQTRAGFGVTIELRSLQLS